MAVPATLPHRFVVLRFAVPSAPRFLTAAMNLVYRCPRAALRFFFRHITFEVPLLDVLRLPLLFIRVFALIPSRHGSSFIYLFALQEPRTEPPCIDSCSENVYLSAVARNQLGRR